MPLYSDNTRRQTLDSELTYVIANRCGEVSEESIVEAMNRFSAAVKLTPSRTPLHVQQLSERGSVQITIPYAGSYNFSFKKVTPGAKLESGQVGTATMVRLSIGDQEYSIDNAPL